VPVECEGALEIVDAEAEERDAWFHTTSFGARPDTTPHHARTYVLITQHVPRRRVPSRACEDLVCICTNTDPAHGPSVHLEQRVSNLYRGGSMAQNGGNQDDGTSQHQQTLAEARAAGVARILIDESDLQREIRAIARELDEEYRGDR